MATRFSKAMLVEQLRRRGEALGAHRGFTERTGTAQLGVSGRMNARENALIDKAVDYGRWVAMMDIAAEVEDGRIGVRAAHLPAPSPAQAPKSRRRKNTLTLKWGKLKSCEFNSAEGQDLLVRYDNLNTGGEAASPEVMDILCQMIDICGGPKAKIFLEWDDIWVSKVVAKEYVRRY